MILISFKLCDYKAMPALNIKDLMYIKCFHFFVLDDQFGNNVDIVDTILL